MPPVGGITQFLLKLSSCAVNPRHSWRGYKARFVSIWRILLLNILPQYRYWCATNGCREIGATPQNSFPVIFLDLGKLFSQQATGYSFKAIHQLRQLHVRWKINQQMHVIVFAIHFCKFNTCALANITKNGAHRDDMLSLKNLLPVLRGEHQMCVQQKHAVTS